jgi:hypothetical protein
MARNDLKKEFIEEIEQLFSLFRTIRSLKAKASLRVRFTWEIAAKGYGDCQVNRRQVPRHRPRSQPGPPEFRRPVSSTVASGE